ncbi:MAG: hypothetical protein CBC29_05815 [Methylococcaceae bacterium TMED69]|nr:MAG: hypothetical protein CBC29_05815 [Methylococcaceae bacterium TMED69]|tara:strand:+ start:232 stop:420 length:189 start_codon:yes stop_codon:yes gene_type:complete
MNENDLSILIDVRQHIIAIYDYLEHKNMPHAMISQQVIAKELDVVIPKIDKILKDKVTFSKG